MEGDPISRTGRGSEYCDLTQEASGSPEIPGKLGLHSMTLSWKTTKKTKENPNTETSKADPPHRQCFCVKMEARGGLIAGYIILHTWSTQSFRTERAIQRNHVLGEKK